MQNTDEIDARRLTLAEVAQIQAGYLSRERVEVVAEGTHRLLLARDVSEGQGVRAEDAIRFFPERNPEPYQVEAGDVLLVARGQVHGAHLIEEDLPNTLASSVFYILRPRRESVLPAYLTWWLNQPDVQAEINAGAGGTGISYLGRQAVERLGVAVPPLSLQQRVVEVMDLFRRGKALQTAIEERRELLVQSICKNAILSTID